MNKKLLMNNYSKNGLMPVTEGLICWLDGRDASGTDRIWQDRSGNENNCKLANNLKFSDTVGWTGNSLMLDGLNNTFGELYTIQKVTENNWTFELKFNNKKNGTGLLSNMSPYSGKGFSVFHDGNKIGFEIRKEKGESKKFPFDFIGNNIVTLTINENGEVKLYKNGIYLLAMQYETLNGNFPGSSGIYWKLGSYGNSSYGMNGEIFSLRIYSRILTEKEIYQNYLYEQTIKRGE